MLRMEWGTTRRGLRDEHRLRGALRACCRGMGLFVGWTRVHGCFFLGMGAWAPMLM